MHSKPCRVQQLLPATPARFCQYPYQRTVQLLLEQVVLDAVIHFTSDPRDERFAHEWRIKPARVGTTRTWNELSM